MQHKVFQKKVSRSTALMHTHRFVRTYTLPSLKVQDLFAIRGCSHSLVNALMYCTVQHSTEYFTSTTFSMSHRLLICPQLDVSVQRTVGLNLLYVVHSLVNALMYSTAQYYVLHVSWTSHLSPVERECAAYLWVAI